MKKLFVFSTLLLIFALSYKVYLSEDSQDFSTGKYEGYTQEEGPREKENQPLKTSPHRPPIKPKKIEPKTPAKKSISSAAAPLDERHVAQTDPQGKIYPRSVKVDDDMIVAYGDLIVGSADDLDAYQSGDKVLNIPPPQLWPKGSIPYEIDKSLDDPTQVETIKNIIQSLNDWGHLDIHPRKEDEDNFVLFKRGGQHCYANVGFRFGVTNVSLSPGCGEKEIFHEFFHVLGFFHEQNRPDRDDFIEVLWENIDEENWAQFEKFSVESYPQELRDLNATVFEFNSIMLYDSRAFSNTSDYSMVRVDGTPFSQSFERPTPTDLDRLKRLYPSKNR